MTLRSVLSEVDSLEKRVVARLRVLQGTDGGFNAYFAHDSESGIWSTSGSVAVLADLSGTKEAVLKGREYLAGCQNPDGGWGFRKLGKSITDITAWACLALDPSVHCASIRRGLQFLIHARINTDGINEDGWGLTSFERDRVYSTWIASRCLRRYRALDTYEALHEQIDVALAESQRWVISTMLPNGSWGVSAGAGTNGASTSVALLTLFEGGVKVSDYKCSCEYLLDQRKGNLWDAESEIIVTQEGYELEQTWFTSALCFLTLVHFSKHGMVTIRQIHEAFEAFSSLVRSNGQVVISPDSKADMVWPIPYAIMALREYRAFLNDRGQLISAFLSDRQSELILARKREMSSILQDRFPYPISHGFFVYQHELDYHRRFGLLLQLYEVSIKFAAIVGLSGFLAQKETEPSIVRLLEHGFRKPSLGHWTDLLLKLLKNSKGFEKLIGPQTSEEIIRANKMYLCPDDNRLSLGEALEGIVQMRNSMSGHGAVRSVYEYKQICEKEDDKLFSFLDRFKFLSRSDSFLVLASYYDEFGSEDRYHIRIFRGLNISDSQFETTSRLSEGQQDALVRYIYFQNSTSDVVVNLYPFLSYMFCDECKHERFFFFNNMKSDVAASYLSFECGHIAVKNNGAHFLKRLRSSSVSWS
jgi:hypothetical protein